MVRFLACGAGLTFGGARLVGAMGLTAVGACVRGLGAWWMPLGRHFVDLIFGTGNTGLVHTGDLIAADDDLYLFEGGM